MRRRRILTRTFTLDVGALAAAAVAASLWVFDVAIPWTIPPYLTGFRSPLPMLVLLLVGLTLGSWLTARAIGIGVPRPSYGRAVGIAGATFGTPALATFLARDAFYYSRPFIGISAVIFLGLGLIHRAIARSRPWSEPMVLVTREKKLIEDLMLAPHAQVLEVIDPGQEEAPQPLPTGVTLAVDLRAVLSDPMAQFVASTNLAGYRLRSLADVYEEHTGRLAIVHLAEGWELRTPVEETSTYALVKRALDVLLVTLASPLAGVLGALVWSAVRVSSPGPAILRQTRVGRHGKAFTLYKFRTMVVDAEKDGPRLATPDDPRRTPIGRWLRKTRIDELPQLWNVLKGDVSLVGPRPERPVFVSQFARTIPFYEYRHLVRPGLTGWAQVNYGYADDEADTIEKLTFDLYYVKHMSPWLDLHVLGKSVWTVLSGFGAH